MKGMNLRLRPIERCGKDVPKRCSVLLRNLHVAMLGVITLMASLPGVTLASSTIVQSASVDTVSMFASRGLSFDASVLPTPWWVQRHGELDADEDALSLFPARSGLTSSIDSGEVDQLWAKRWTLTSRATRLGNREFDNTKAWTGVSFDFKRQLLDQNERASIALGLGWALVDAANGAVAAPRLSLEGHFGISKRWSLYGQSAWLADTSELGDGLGDILEAGLSWQPTPSVLLRAGFRRHRLRLGESESDSGNASESNSIIFGAGWRW